LERNGISQKVIVFSNVSSDFKVLSDLIYWYALQISPKSVQLNQKIVKNLSSENNENRVKMAEQTKP
jgi:hypothetical protein